MPSNFLTFDFGKSSIRTIVGVYNSDNLQMYEINRIPSIPLEEDNHTYLNVGLYMQTIIEGMIKAAKEFGKVESLGIGFWGGVFALLNSDGRSFRYPLHYSDIIFKKNRELLRSKISSEEVYVGYDGGATTSSVSMLLAIKEELSKEFSEASSILMMPDYLAYLLTGTISSEETIISSGGLSNVYKQWNKKLFDYLNIPINLFSTIVKPGTIYPLLPIFTSLDTNLADTQYVRIASHDTASAVSTLNMQKNTAFISSGSTSIIGVITDEPILSKKAYKDGLLNEIAADGKIRLCRNINGMTIQNNCIIYWNRDGITFSFDEIEKEIFNVPQLKYMINPNSNACTSSDDTPLAIMEYFKTNDREIPTSPPEILSAINTGLAMEYRRTIESLEAATGNHIDTIYIVGGGLQNKVLCQYAANATGCKVVTGNKEATSIGNILMQAKALKLFTDYSDISRITSNSYPESNTYYPKNTQEWERCYTDYLRMES